MILACILWFLIAPIGRPLYATWTEPSHEDVVRSARAFVKASVLDNDPAAGPSGAVTFKLIEAGAGIDVSPVFVVNGFSRLRLMSITIDNYPKLPFRTGEVYWLFLETAGLGDGWRVATPESGSARVSGDQVHATYHNSMRRADVSEDLYRRTQTAIFERLHGRPFDPAVMRTCVETSLQRPPVGPDFDLTSAQTRLFIDQHVALETFYHLGQVSDAAVLEPFLRSAIEQVALSAVRALSRLDSVATRLRLVVILKSEAPLAARTAAVDALRRLDARALAGELESLVESLPDDHVGYHLDFMDGRIGTPDPGSPKRALKRLLKDWRKPSTHLPR